MRIGIGAINGYGLGLAPPAIPACANPTNPSNDPAVFVSDPAYIRGLNLTALCNQANVVNSNLAQSGNQNFVGVNPDAFDAWWAAVEATYTPGSPTYGQDPPTAVSMGVFTGVDTSNIFETVFIPGSASLPIVPTAAMQRDSIGQSYANPCTPSMSAAECLAAYGITGSGVTVGTPYTPPAPGLVTTAPVPGTNIQPTQSQVGIGPGSSSASTQGSTTGGTTGGTTGSTSTSNPLDFLTESTIISSVPNWAVLAGAAALLFLLPSLMKGTR